MWEKRVQTLDTLEREKSRQIQLENCLEHAHTHNSLCSLYSGSSNHFQLDLPEGWDDIFNEAEH